MLNGWKYENIFLVTVVKTHGFINNKNKNIKIYNKNNKYFTSLVTVVKTYVCTAGSQPLSSNYPSSFLPLPIIDVGILEQFLNPKAIGS